MLWLGVMVCYVFVAMAIFPQHAPLSFSFVFIFRFCLIYNFCFFFMPKPNVRTNRSCFVWQHVLQSFSICLNIEKSLRAAYRSFHWILEVLCGLLALRWRTPTFHQCRVLAGVYQHACFEAHFRLIRDFIRLKCLYEVNVLGLNVF